MDPDLLDTDPPENDKAGNLLITLLIIWFLNYRENDEKNFKYPNITPVFRPYNVALPQHFKWRNYISTAQREWELLGP